MKLFVYGTLMDAAPSRIMRSLAAARGVTVENLGPAMVTGAELYDLGWFPAMTAGNGVVCGELFEVPDSLVDRLDQYENAPHLYRRKAVSVLLCHPIGTPIAESDTPVVAEAYFICRKPPAESRIECGDWLRHMHLKGKL